MAEEAYLPLISLGKHLWSKLNCDILNGFFNENDGKNLRIFREVRSTDNVELLIEPGEKAIWDDRFLVEVFEKAPKPVIIRHLTESQFLGLDNSGHNRSTQPVRSRAGLVSIWSEKHLQAVPQINYYSSSSNYNENTVPYRVTFNNYLQIYGTGYEN